MDVTEPVALIRCLPWSYNVLLFSSLYVFISASKNKVPHVFHTMPVGASMSLSVPMTHARGRHLGPLHHSKCGTGHLVQVQLD